MKTTLFFIAVLVLLGMAWIRFAPTDRDRWHIDPAEAESPEPRGVRLIGREAPRFPGGPDEVLAAFREIALAEPRVRVLDGGLDEGMITFVARTRIMGFRDYITVKAVAEGDQTKLSIVSRSRYSVGSDWGVNRERLDRWLAELQLLLT